MNIDERSDYAWLAITAAADSYTACIWAPFNHPFGFTIRAQIYSPKLLLSGPVNTNERSADLAMEASTGLPTHHNDCHWATFINCPYLSYLYNPFAFPINLPQPTTPHLYSLQMRIVKM